MKIRQTLRDWWNDYGDLLEYAIEVTAAIIAVAWLAQLLLGGYL